MEFDECFGVLEVPPTASADEVRKSYRTLVSVWHPDRFTGNQALRAEAERKLKAINEAFETLEAAGFPQAQAAPRVRPDDHIEAGAAEPISRGVQHTLRLTTIAVLALVFWLGLSGKSLPERAFGSIFAAFLLGSAFSQMVLHVVWSFKARPQTWIVLLGASAAMTVGLSDRDPSLGPVLGVVGFLGGLLLVFILFYVRTRPSQSLRTRIWNRLVGFGFVAMLVVAGISLIFSLPVLAIAVSWIYWFGWTWISWLIAGRLAVQHSNA